MWRDWCPLCGTRFEADDPDTLCQKIIDHLKEKNGDKSECEKHWVSFSEALIDDHYEAKKPNFNQGQQRREKEMTMKVTDYPIRDETSGTTYNRLKKIEASNGEFILVGSNIVIYASLMDFLDKQIAHYTFRVSDYKRNCDGRRYALKELEIWERIKAEITA